MELWLNGNFLNWFWRGAQTEPAWRDIERRRRGFLFCSHLYFTLSLSLDMFQPSSPLAQSFFYPTLKFHRHTSVLLFQSFLLNLNSQLPVLTFSVHILYLYDVIILTISSFYSSVIICSRPKTSSLFYFLVKGFFWGTVFFIYLLWKPFFKCAIYDFKLLGSPNKHIVFRNLWACIGAK